MKFLFAFVFILLTHFLFCQDKSLDSVQIDTISKFSVKKAVIYSAVLPGAGQFYNYLATTKGKKVNRVNKTKEASKTKKE